MEQPDYSSTLRSLLFRGLLAGFNVYEGINDQGVNSAGAGKAAIPEKTDIFGSRIKNRDFLKK